MRKPPDISGASFLLPLRPPRLPFFSPLLHGQGQGLKNTPARESAAKQYFFSSFFPPSRAANNKPLLKRNGENQLYRLIDSHLCRCGSTATLATQETAHAFDCVPLVRILTANNEPLPLQVTPLSSRSFSRGARGRATLTSSAGEDDEQCRAATPCQGRKGGSALGWWNVVYPDAPNMGGRVTQTPRPVCEKVKREKRSCALAKDVRWSALYYTRASCVCPRCVEQTSSS